MLLWLSILKGLKWMNKLVKMELGVKLCDVEKMVLILVKVLLIEKNEMLCKLEWLKICLLKLIECIDGIK